MYLFVGILLFLSLAAAVPVALNFWRRQQDVSSHRRANYEAASRRSAAAGSTPRRRHFKASSIVPGENCCPAITKLAGARFLTDESPILPLERCDRIAECKCTFVHHADRRCGDDRRNPVGALSSHGQIGSSQVNRRAGMDRRSGMDDELDDISIF